MKSIEDKELEIKVKKILLHKKIHVLLQDIKGEYLKINTKEAGEFDQEENNY